MNELFTNWLHSGDKGLLRLVLPRETHLFLRAEKRPGFDYDIAKKKVCADCVGGCKGYAWTNGGVGVLESIGTSKDLFQQVRRAWLPGQERQWDVQLCQEQGLRMGRYFHTSGDSRHCAAL